MAFLLALLLGVSVSVAADLPLTIGTDYAGRGYYRYCPAVLDVAGTRHVFYCRNRSAYSVVDHIYHATVSPTGSLVDESVALASADSTGTAWDSYHVCDPSVVAGRFHYAGHVYRYLMAYLGVRGRPGDASCDGAKCQNNKVGLAVSDSLAGGWVRMGAEAVVVSDKSGTWGVGQPSLVSLDSAGKVALFYAGDYGTRVLTLDFGTPDAAAASRVSHVGSAGVEVSKTGIGDLKGLRASGVTITNGDFAWNPETGSLTLSLDVPDRFDDFYDEGIYNLSITKAVAVYRAAVGEFSAARLASVRWEPVVRVCPADLAADFSSSFRIHNSGLARTVSGALAEKTVFVSLAHLEPNPLYTYRFQPVRWGRDLDWFDGGLGSEEREAWGGSWTGDIPRRDGLLVLDGADTNEVGFLATQRQRMTKSGRVARIAADIMFEYETTLPPLEAQDKAGLTIHDGSYWGVAADPDGGASNVWRRLAGKTPALDVPTSVVCEIRCVKGANQVAYAIDGETLATFPIVLQERAVSSTVFGGNGQVSLLVGTFENGLAEGLSVWVK